MISFLVSVLILCLVFAIFWWILSMIPIPGEFQWIVKVLVAIVFLIAVVSLLGGAWAFPLHGVLR